MHLAANTLLQNRYLILRLIGKGGMGAVYEAKDQRLGHRVALKQMLLSGELLERSFEREGRVLARLRHTALPNVTDYFKEDNSHFLVMEYVEGDDLEKLLLEKRVFLLEEVLLWADELLDALEYLHNQTPPVIHRDIKPANIKLLPNGHVVLLDFGLSKGGSAYSQHMTTDKWSLYGYTPHYAPLEQIEGTGTDQRSDLYSLGTTLYHLLSGTQLPSAVTRARAQLGQAPDPLRPLHDLNPQIPLSISNILKVAMNLNPAERPPNAQVMRKVLRKAAKRSLGKINVSYPSMIAPPTPPPLVPVQSQQPKSPTTSIPPIPPIVSPTPDVTNLPPKSLGPNKKKNSGDPSTSEQVGRAGDLSVIKEQNNEATSPEPVLVLQPVSVPQPVSVIPTYDEEEKSRKSQKWSIALLGMIFLMAFFCMVIAGARLGLFLHSNADGPTPTVTVTVIPTDITSEALTTPILATETATDTTTDSVIQTPKPIEEEPKPTEVSKTATVESEELISATSTATLIVTPTVESSPDSLSETEIVPTQTSEASPTMTVTKEVPEKETEVVPEKATEVVPEKATEVIPEKANEVVPEKATEVVPEIIATQTSLVLPRPPATKPSATATIYIKPSATSTTYVEEVKPSATPTTYVEEIKPSATPTTYVEEIKPSATATATTYVEEIKPTFTPTADLEEVEVTFTPTADLEEVEPTFTPTADLEEVEVTFTPTADLEEVEPTFTPTADLEEIKEIEEIEPTFTPTIYVEEIEPTFTPTIYVEEIEPTFTPTVYVEPTFTSTPLPEAQPEPEPEPEPELELIAPSPTP